MARWRAVPTAVSTAVAALVFLASVGLAVVLGAGLQVWSGPTTPRGFDGQAQPGSISVTNRVGGVVTVTPPAPPTRRPQPGSGTSGPTITLPFIPFAPPAAPAAPAVSAPAAPSLVAGQPVARSGGGHGLLVRAAGRGARELPTSLRALLNRLLAAATGQGSDEQATPRASADRRQALRAERSARKGADGAARRAAGHHGRQRLAHGHHRRAEARMEQRRHGRSGRRHHGHRDGQRHARVHGHAHGHHND